MMFQFRSRVDNRTYMGYIAETDDLKPATFISEVEMTGALNEDASILFADNEITARQLAGTMLRLYPGNMYIVAKSISVMFREYLPEQTANFTEEGLLPV